MRRMTKTEKILRLFSGAALEIGAFIYPYKGIGWEFHKKYKGSFSDAVYNLTQRGYLEHIEIKGEKCLKLTSKGRLKFISKKLFNKWDGFWRIIAFDIEEDRKKTRDIFRNKLYELKCVPIQKSVWITPYDITVELEELIDILELENNIDYFISKALTNEEKYLNIFSIKDNK